MNKQLNFMSTSASLFTGRSISQEVSGGTLEELEMILTL